MVGPFMQGILLMGIIYWYSKSMMSMINDYYRSEFNRKIQKEDITSNKKPAPLDVDNFMEFVEQEAKAVAGDLKPTTEPEQKLSVPVLSKSCSANESFWHFLILMGVRYDFCSLEQFSQSVM